MSSEIIRPVFLGSESRFSGQKTAFDTDLNQPTSRITISEVNSTAGAQIEQIAPSLKPKTAVDNKASAYICENYACKAPATDIDKLGKMLTDD